MTATALTQLIGIESKGQGRIHFQVNLDGKENPNPTATKARSNRNRPKGKDKHGNFENFMEAIQYKNLVIDQGYCDASIAAFFNKQKIKVEDAIIFQNTFKRVDEETMNERSEDSYWNSLRYEIHVGKHDEDSDLEPLLNLGDVKSRVGEGCIYYTFGEFSSHSHALIAKEEVFKSGITNVFLVAFIDGEKVLVEEAVIFEAFRNQMSLEAPEMN